MRASSARTSMQHAIDRKAIRSGLSVALFITLPGSLLREDPPARLPMESLQRLRYFLLSFSLPLSSYSPYGLLISHSSDPFLPSRQARFSYETQKIERRSIQVKVKEPFHSPKYFHTRCGFSYFWQTSVMRFARRCRNRPARCSYQIEYMLV